MPVPREEEEPQPALGSVGLTPPATPVAVAEETSSDVTSGDDGVAPVVIIQDAAP